MGAGWLLRGELIVLESCWPNTHSPRSDVIRAPRAQFYTVTQGRGWGSVSDGGGPGTRQHVPSDVELWLINPPAHTGGSWNLALISKAQWDLLLSWTWIDRMEGRAPVWEVEVKCWDVASACLSPSLSFGFLYDPFMILLGKLFDLYVAVSTSLERKKMKNTHLIRLLWGILRSS